jgi:actin interacting protein 3
MASPAKELTLFLQCETMTKKYVLPETDVTLERLQQAFIEKFEWNPLVDLPTIYIKDPRFDVQYQLEDLKDIKDGSCLVLKEALGDAKSKFY